MSQDYAEISAGGGRYRFWKGITVTRDFSNPVSQLTINATEISDGVRKWSDIKLKPGDPATALLNGELVITGKVTARQVTYNKNSHGCQFIVESQITDAAGATVEAKPGEYKKYTLEQIANDVLGKVGVSFRIDGSPQGADKKFDIVRVQPGEGVFEIVERLCRMRNLHLVDDDAGGLVASRGSDGGGSALEEGRNILNANLLWQDRYANSQIRVFGDQPGNNEHWADDVRANSATAKNPNYSGKRPLHILAEQPGDKQDMQMRADHEVDVNVGGMLTAEITARGWRDDSGQLWIRRIGKTISVRSPMLFPQDTMDLAIQTVVHKQDNDQGSITVLSLVLPRRLGSKTPLPANGPSAASPAKPDEVS